MSTMKAIRDRLGLTQAGLAAKLGRTQGNVGHYEKGQTVPPDVAMRLVGVARELGVELTLDHIYGLQPLTAPPPVATATPDHHDTGMRRRITDVERGAPAMGGR